MASPDKNTSVFRSFLGRFMPSSRNESASTSSQPSSSNGKNVTTVDLDEPAQINGASPLLTNARNLRYLSPTAMDTTFSRSSEARAEADATDGAQSRKRQLIDSEEMRDLDSLFPSDSVKRFRATAGNTSLIAEPMSRSYLPPPRLDMTWSGIQCSDSPSMLTNSPGGSSMRSLRSRISRAPSNASALSSRTAAILGHIEKINTPAKEALRMPLMRVGMEKERWAPLSATPSAAPPLQRLSAAIPSRANIISSVLSSAHKKPYWRDMSRQQAASNHREDEVIALDEGLKEKVASSAVLSPLFDTSSSARQRRTSDSAARANGQTPHPQRREPILKASDGSAVNRSRNRFSARGFSEEDQQDAQEDTTWMERARGSLPESAAPKAGFLADTAAFSFSKPVLHITPATAAAEESNGEDDDEDESGSSVESDESDEESGSEVSDDSGENIPEATPSKPQEVDRPSEHSSTSSSDRPDSSPDSGSGKENGKTKNQLQSTKQAAPSLFPSISSIPSVKPNGFGSSSSNGASPLINSGFQFGAKQSIPSITVTAAVTSASSVLAVSAPSTAPVAIPSAASSITSAARKAWDCPTCCISNKATDAKCCACGHEMYPESKVERTDWDCPTCCVHNKGSAAKCVACSHEMYKEEASAAAPSSVFGDKAFKPIAAPAGVSFGFGSSTGTASKPAGISFGFGASAPAVSSSPLVAVSSAAPVASTAPSTSFTLPTPSTVAATTSTSGAPKFGLLGATTTVASSITTPSFPSVSGPPTGLFGAPSKPASALSSTVTSSAPSSTPILSFGTVAAPSSTVSAPFSSASIPSTSSASSLFSAAPSSGLFGGPLKPPLFGASAATPSPFSMPAPSLLSSGTAAPPLAFGQPAAAAPKLSFNLGGDSAKPAVPVFGQKASSSDGRVDEGPSAKKPFAFGSFSSTSSTTSISTGPSLNQPLVFGGGNITASGSAVSTFGQSGAAPVFGAPPAAASSSSLFSAPSAAPPSSFNFGAPPSSGSLFTFGNSQPGATPFGAVAVPSAAPSLGLGLPSAPSANPFPMASSNSASNAFAFSSGAAGQRKTAVAKRRLMGKGPGR